MNKKGYITLSILVIILLVTSFVLLLFYKPILETSKEVAKSSLLSEQLANDINGKERLYSLLKENASINGNIDYEDLKRNYNIETVDEDYIIKELHFASHELNNFSINNKTNIEIDLVVTPDNPSLPYSYDVELILDNYDLLEGSGLGLNTSNNIIVPANKIYNETTGETNYGNYLLNIPTSNNCTVKAVLVFNELIHREIKITGDYEERIVLEKNNGKFNIISERR